jgi:mannose-6-phosphate isomerase-like protein (cupin superfamily)
MKKSNRSTGRLLALCLAGIAAFGPMAPLHAQDSMNAPGAEGTALAAREGWWDVVETSWARPGAEPEVIRGQVAHRQMVGLYLQEMLYAPGKRADAKVHRMDYLGFNRVTGRWDYLSMDTRVAAGLMPAWSFEHDAPGRIRVQFEPFSTPGGGGAVRGQMLRMEEIIEQTGPDSETKDQYFILADGSGTKWLGHRYAYVRQKG